MRKKFGVLFVGLAAVLAVASAAYACAVLTTLSVDPGKAKAGKTVTGFGGNYRSNTAGEDPVYSDVTITLESRDGKVLATTVPNPDRTIDFDFKIPRGLKPGWYTVLATQYTLADGRPVAGTPGRASFKVKPRRSGAQVVPIGWADSDRYAPQGYRAPATAPVSESTANIFLITALLGLGTSSLVLLRRRNLKGVGA